MLDKKVIRSRPYKNFFGYQGLLAGSGNQCSTCKLLFVREVLLHYCLKMHHSRNCNVTMDLLHNVWKLHMHTEKNCPCQPIGMLGRSSGNHDWLLANASACVSCGFRLRNARNASDCDEWKPGFTLCTISRLCNIICKTSTISRRPLAIHP